MNGDDLTGDGTAERSGRGNRGRWRGKSTPYLRSGALAAILAAGASALAACGSPGSPTGAATSATVASLGKGASDGGSPTSDPSRNSTSDQGGSTTTTLPKGDDATRLVDEWAACERHHGDPGQADPIIDSHGVINITLPSGGLPAGDPHDVTGTCSQYLAAAQVALRAADPVADPQGVTSTATIIAFANCMRANGVPNYPYPSGPNDSQTNFNGTGVDPNSPQVVRVNDLCGKKLGLPTWWINGWGPPGDVSVSMSGPPGSNHPGPPGNPPACTYLKKGCGGHGGNAFVPNGADVPRPATAGHG